MTEVFPWPGGPQITTGSRAAIHMIRVLYIAAYSSSVVIVMLLIGGT